MNPILRECLIVCPLVFLAGFIDSVAGGGGIVSIPAYFLAGLPTRSALGTNKCAMFCGTSLSTFKYLKSGKVILKIAVISAIGSLIGSSIGTSLALVIPENILKTALMCILPAVAIFLLVKKDFGSGAEHIQLPIWKTIVLSLLIGLFIGCYDGLVGPGTGTFLIMAFSGLLKLDLLTASGCSKVSNLASNLASLVIYAINGEVVVLVAIPAAVFCMCGNFLGAKYAIRGGSKNVRKIMLVVIVLLLAKTGLDLIGVSVGS